jgi:hypothetical protein
LELLIPLLTNRTCTSSEIRRGLGGVGRFTPLDRFDLNSEVHQEFAFGVEYSCFASVGNVTGEQSSLRRST